MTEHSLRHCRILVVEDEYLLAHELSTELGELGAIVVGPVGRLDQALELVHREPHIDGAIVDVNLGGEMVYSLADLLMSRDIPFVFTTGYDASALPSRYADVPRCEKPVSMTKIVEAVGSLLHPGE